MNSVVISGFLGADPELKYTSTGTAVCNMSLAVNESYIDSTGDKQSKTSWVRVVVWGKSAEYARETYKKGNLILVGGKLSTSSYVGKDGVTRITPVVSASSVELMAKATKKESAAISSTDEPPMGEDEIPF